MALHFSLMWVSGKQCEVLLESIRRVRKEIGSMPGWGGMNRGIKDFKYNFYPLVWIGIQLQGIVELTGLRWVVSPMTGIQ